MSGSMFRILVVLGAWSAGVFAQPAGGPPPANVVVAPVVQRVIEQKRRVTGEVRALRQSALAAREPGQVVDLLVDAGDKVEEGMLIARLDAQTLSLELAQSQANIPVAQALIHEREAQADQARRDLARMRQLVELESGSEIELDHADRDAAVAEARLAQAKAQLAVTRAQVALIQKQIADLEIRAPFSGRVLRKRTEIGQWVHAGDAVVDLIEVSSLEIRVDVPESVIEKASHATTVSVLVPALGEEIQAKVLAVIPQADERTRMFPVRLVVDNPEGSLRPGMSAIGLVPTSRKAPTLLVPKDSILLSETGAYVYVDQGGRASMMPVERLFAFEDQVAVRSNMLQAGTMVVTQGNERLFPGQPLTILNELQDEAGPDSGTP